MNIPAHLPRKLTITLWDFSWYTMTMPGEPYYDLEKAFREAVERGYNTIRICAMPSFLFTPEGARELTLAISNLGNGVGIRTRWYTNRGGAELDGRAHLLNLFRLAKKYNVFIILSNWEYQQSPGFLRTRELYDELMSVPPKDRFMYISRTMSQLLTFIQEHGLSDRVAYVELHNEVEFGRLADVGAQPETSVNPHAAVHGGMKPYLEEALSSLRQAHPEHLITSCAVLNHPYSKDVMPSNLDVAHFHLYLHNGVFNDVMNKFGLFKEDETFPSSVVKRLLREDAPTFDTYHLPRGEEWRLGVNPNSLRLFYLHDWIDPVKWDLYFYRLYPMHHESMKLMTTERLTEVAELAEKRGIPAVIGEGFIGYTPIESNFEEGPIGKDVAEFVVKETMRLGYWGTVLCSNCAPHHPFWNDVKWQRKWNQYILDGGE